MSDIKAEINAAIEKNLPTQVGNVLKQTLDDGAKAKTELDELRIRYKSFEEKYQKIGLEIEGLKKLELKDQELKKREFNLELEKLKHELACEKNVSYAYREFVTLVCKNPSHTQSGSIYDSQNGSSKTFNTTSEVTK